MTMRNGTNFTSRCISNTLWSMFENFRLLHVSYLDIILVAGYRAKGIVDRHRRINLLRGSGENKIGSNSEEQP